MAARVAKESRLQPKIHAAREGAPDAPDVTVLIPCLNEEESVAGVVRQAFAGLAQAGLRGDVIVVDNGSEDRTAELAAAAGARVIKERRRGKGYAVQTGIRESTGTYIVMADGDGTYDLTQLEALIRPLRDGYDMVIGNRLRGQMAQRSMPWLHRYVGNPLFGALVSLIAGQRFGDCLSGLRSFRRDAWHAMAPTSPGFELESEMCLRAGRHGLRVTEIPVAYGVRAAPSKLRGVAHGWAITRFIILESADIIFFFPAMIAVALGVVSLALGIAVTRGVEVGSVHWQPVFAGGILVPAGIGFMALGLAAKWQAWRRGIAQPNRLVRALNESPSRLLESILLSGLLMLLAGVALDGYLLWGWAQNEPPARALGLGAVAQTMMIAGLNLIVTAALLGVLRSDVRMEEVAGTEAAARDDDAG